jgi:hypothetical protein
MIKILFTWNFQEVMGKIVSGGTETRTLSKRLSELNIPPPTGKRKQKRSGITMQKPFGRVEERAFVGFLATGNRTACFASNVLCADYLRRPSVCGVRLKVEVGSWKRSPMQDFLHHKFSTQTRLISE